MFLCYTVKENMYLIWRNYIFKSKKFFFLTVQRRNISLNQRSFSLGVGLNVGDRLSIIIEDQIYKNIVPLKNIHK